MKVVAFNGSPHKNGVIFTGITTIAGELAKEGIETEIIQVGSENIQGCISCYSCKKTGKCFYDGDMVNSCREKAVAADGFIIGSPTYYGGIAGNFKCFLDRMFIAGLRLNFKPAYAFASLRRSGGISVFHQLNNYLNLGGALIVPNNYWGVIHGNNPEELSQDIEGLTILRLAGQNMAYLIKVLAEGKKTLPLPVAEPYTKTNFIR